jgi:hypothetical protein
MEEKHASEAHHPHQVGDEPVTSVLTGHEVPVLPDGYSADEEVLAALGYKYAASPFSSSVHSSGAC